MAVDFGGTATSFFSGSVAGLGKGLMIFLIFALVIGMIAGLVFYVRNKKKYKIKVEIYRKLGNKWVILEDMGASMKKKGIEYLQLKKLKKPLPFPDLSNFIGGIKGRGYLKMIQTSVGRIEPMSLTIHNPSHIVDLERDQSNWDMWYVGAGEIIEKSFAWKSALMKYLPYIGVIVLVVGVIIVLSLIVQQLAPISAELSGVKDGLSQIAGKLVGGETGGSGW